MFGGEEYQCPFDDQTICDNKTRIFDYDYFVGFDLLNARFERKMKKFTTEEDTGAFTMTDPDFLFVVTGTNFDLQKQYDAY